MEKLRKKLEGKIRFYDLLEKRKTLTATIREEEDLIELAKLLPPSELELIDPELLTYSNEKRLASLMDKLNKIL